MSHVLFLLKSVVLPHKEIDNYREAASGEC